jgi:undecaprenyl-diphosphatase
VSGRGERTGGAQTGGAVARLRWSARELRRRWRVRRGAPAPLDPARALMIAGLLALAIAAVALFLDAALTQWVREWPRGLRRVFAYVTMLGDSLYIFVLSALVIVGALLARARAGISRALDAALATLAARAFFVFAVCAGSGVLSQVLKRLIGRARPRLFDEHGPFHFVFPGFPSTYASFPSGHTITAFACAAAVAWFAPRWRWPLFGLAALVGVSRVAVGAHYASDVVAGAAIGFLSAAALRRAFAARGVAFRLAGSRILVRRAGLIWPALRGGMR